LSTFINATSGGRAGGNADIRIELLASKTEFTVYAILAADVPRSSPVIEIR
jgi:hypothetical protein